MQPIIFQPLYMERVWGGRKLEEVYNRELPSDQPHGESWEITDREEDQSVVAKGIFKGKTLNELWTQHKEEVFGQGLPDSARFPLLIKILDARSDLSIQVHPPTDIAKKFGGEAKTEMWYIADVDPDAKLYVGLKEGVSKQDFENAIKNGTVDEVVHVIQPEVGESIFIESGRLHAIGSGFLIYEIQENSDTTYRVFDWNRLGLDGKPRQLHVEESLACIDFDDHEPTMDTPNGESIAACEHFNVDERNFSEGDKINLKKPEQFAIITVVKGTLLDADGNSYPAGSFFLQPANGEPLRAVSTLRISTCMTLIT